MILGRVCIMCGKSFLNFSKALIVGGLRLAKNTSLIRPTLRRYFCR